MELGVPLRIIVGESVSQLGIDLAVAVEGQIGDQFSCVDCCGVEKIQAQEAREIFK